MRKITKIQKTTAQSVKRKRVAAYARVSTGKETMLHSLSAQISHYNSYIGRRGDWEFAGIYADEAVTGTKNNRLEFQRLLSDCRDKKIDMIITKSITRFARNTVTLLETVRELKLLGVDVYFEKENLHSLSADGEFMLTILASYAQEESRSVSENQKWRIRKMFEQGRPTSCNPLGYHLINGTFHIVPEEAEIVKIIFADFLSGMGANSIAKKLNKAGIPTKNGNPSWHESSIRKILRNEKYSGDMLLQKTFKSNHLEKKTKINRGELPMYQVLDSHDPIISKELFEQVQREFKYRTEKYNIEARLGKTHVFSGMIHCGLCGKCYHRKTAHSSSKYANAVWMCHTYSVRGKSYCPSQLIPENILLDKTAEVLGVAELTRDLLEMSISKIRIPGHNRIEYVFEDGRCTAIEWENPSRRFSWDDSMRQAAREKTAARHRKEREK